MQNKSHALDLRSLDLELANSMGAMLVRVPAQTAPQIVSWVPKCQSPASRRQHETIMTQRDLTEPVDKSSHNLKSMGQRQSGLRLESHHRARTHRKSHEMDENQGLHSNGTQQQQTINENQQLLLIVDQQQRVSMPVVGRRVPAKSAGSHELAVMQMQLQTRMQTEPAVAGRRSVRHQQQRAIEHQESYSQHTIEQAARRRTAMKARGNKTSNKPPDSLAPGSHQLELETRSVECGSPCCCCCCNAASFGPTGPPSCSSPPSCQIPCCAEMATTLQLVKAHHSSQRQTRPIQRTVSAQLQPAHSHGAHSHEACSANLTPNPARGLVVERVRAKSAHSSANRGSRAATYHVQPSPHSPPPVPHPKPQLRLLAATLNYQTEMEDRDQLMEAPVEVGHWSPHSAGHFDRLFTTSPKCVNHRQQQYDSLAAELKAKLADPKLAPILLPPKDYDTLSRRQGKLTGIEQRRSTNPQLVGLKNWQQEPASTGPMRLLKEEGAAPISRIHKPSSNAMRDQQQLHEPQIVFKICSAKDSQHEQSSGSVSLIRSRSNSSSGLGSISAGGQSQSSRSPSQSSSSDDMSCSQSSRNTRSSTSSESTTRCQSNNQLERDKWNDPPNSDQCHSGTRWLPSDRGRSGSSSSGQLWNGRVEVPLKINSEGNRDQTYLATKQIIY